MARHLYILLVGLTALSLNTPARGEVFLLHSGGRIEGQWLNQDQEPLAMYEIALTSGGHLTLTAEQVVRVIIKSEALLRYEAELPKVPDSVEGHWSMAEQCRKDNLKMQREIHLRRILEISPDHSDARHALGYSQVDGNWVKPDEWLTRQGYVRHRGSWRLQQEVELDARHELQQQEEQQWRKQLKIWRTSIIRGRNDSAAAMEKLRATDSAYAIAPLTELLSEPDEPKPLKLLYIDILGRFASSGATAALLQRVMTDQDPEVRDRSMDAIKQHGTDHALAFFQKHLRDKQNPVVNRAGWGLGKLGDPRAIPALIEAVVTKHKFQFGALRAASMPAWERAVAGCKWVAAPRSWSKSSRTAMSWPPWSR